MPPRKETITEVNRRIDELCRCRYFEGYLRVFDKDPLCDSKFMPHRDTIEMRRRFPNVGEAIDSCDFIVNHVWKTLDAWDMNKQGAKLISREEFYSRFRKHKDLVVGLEQYSVAQLGEPDVIDRIWRAISLLGLSATGTQVVAGAKALHHLLPNLLPPIDRSFTWKFFKVHDGGFNGKEQELIKLAKTLESEDSSTETSNRILRHIEHKLEQTSAPEGMKRILSGFAQIHQSVEKQHGEGYLSCFVGKTKWATSETKLVDNAIVGYVKHHNL